mgnify:CR=1 FL=1
MDSLESELRTLRECLRESGAREEEEATDAVLAARELKSLRAQMTGLQERSKMAEEMLQVERKRRKDFIKEIGNVI